MSGCEDLGALLLVVDRPLRSLVAANRGVRVEADDQDMTERACLLQVTDVPGMENIEDPVCEDDLPALGTQCRGVLASGLEAFDA